MNDGSCGGNGVVRMLAAEMEESYWLARATKAAHINATHNGRGHRTDLWLALAMALDELRADMVEVGDPCADYTPINPTGDPAGDCVGRMV